jgi:uncharacterized protein with HEPN domain
MERDLATVLDIVLAARRIGLFVADVDEAGFSANEEKRWAVVSQLTIIGEAVRRLSDEFRDARPNIPWKQIAGMRDRLIHGYDKINWSLVWITASSDVPPLLSELAPLVPPQAA